MESLGVGPGNGLVESLALSLGDLELESSRLAGTIGALDNGLAHTMGTQRSV